ncbi:MAG: glutamate racemase [Ginsengibacter sp.]
MIAKAPIGVFDSGYGGLTVLKELGKTLPEYDFLYMGDNARAPYGTRSYETVYEYTLECVKWFFNQGCSLVILACNTASAKALRTIQQNDLPLIYAHKRVLGVIRPTAEVIGNYTKTNEIGILGTKGTVQSGSYFLEIKKFFPHIKVYQQACPLLVPLIENNEYQNAGAEYFIKKYLADLRMQSPGIDTILLGCTHYPVLLNQIDEILHTNIKILSQGEIVAKSLKKYLERHLQIQEQCSKKGQVSFFTTDASEDFEKHSPVFYGKPVSATHIRL